MAQQSRIHRKMLMAAAGNASGPLYVDDVFSTYVYTGNGTSQSITNNIDLSTEGGLVWAKSRSEGTTNYTGDNVLYDTERGATKSLAIANGTGESTDSGVTAFNSDGFTLGSTNHSNFSGDDFVSWTFRKAPKFFDVVTYTGTGSAQNISHNLGSVPGCIIVKRTNSTTNWIVYHRGIDVDGDSAPETDYIMLNATNAASDFVDLWNDTAPTSSVFTVGVSPIVNSSGAPYVAYLFAHNNSDGEFGTNGDEDIIKCGSYTGTANVNLGFEPQWLLVKKANANGSWLMLDIARGFCSSLPIATGIQIFDQTIYANSSSAETQGYIFDPTPTGFKASPNQVAADWGGGNTYIYIAIRRPHKPAESGSEVFAVSDGSGTGVPLFTSSFPVDIGFYLDTASAYARYFGGRLMQGTSLVMNTTAAEITASSNVYDYMNGFYDFSSNLPNFYGWMFKRSPEFMDVVCYEGTGSATTVDHNLGVVPEMMIVKNRDQAFDWRIYHESLGNTQRIFFSTAEAATASTVWNNTSPTASVFTVGTDGGVNASSNSLIAILFATQAGISKVGSYTGNGTSQTIDCGFTSGARFFLCKASSTTGDWFVWDSVRGVVAGDDPFIILNDTDAEDTLSSGTSAVGDHVDPDSSGIIVNETTGVSINASGVSYVFLAVS